MKILVAMTQWVSGILLLALTSVNAVAQEAPVKRIIALSPHAVEMLFAIGAGEQIVAATDHADYPKQALDIPRIGGYYGVVIEKVLALKPDLIVTWGDGNKSEDIEQLKKLGFKVFDSSPKALDDVAVNMISLGKLTGHEQQAQQVAEKYRQQIQHNTKMLTYTDISDYACFIISKSFSFELRYLALSLEIYLLSHLTQILLPW